MLKAYLHLRFASSWACVDPDDLQAMPVESRRAPRRRTALAAAAEATAAKIGRRFALGGRDEGDGGDEMAKNWWMNTEIISLLIKSSTTARKLFHTQTTICRTNTTY